MAVLNSSLRMSFETRLEWIQRNMANLRASKFRHRQEVRPIDDPLGERVGLVQGRRDEHGSYTVSMSNSSGLVCFYYEWELEACA